MDVILLGGGGAMGTGIVRDLLSDKSSDKVEKIVVADHSRKRTENIVEELDDERLEAMKLDVSDRDETLEVLKGSDVCVNCVPTLAGFQMEITKMCLESGVAYMDLGGLFHTTLKQKDMEQDFIEEGIPGVLGMGSAPGMTNVLAGYGAEGYDEVDSIEVYWAGKEVGDSSGSEEEIPVFVPPYSIHTLVDEFAARSTQFIDGEYVEKEACSGRKTVSFPEPFGKLTTFHTIHSEPATLPRSLEDKGIKEVTWRLWPTEGLNTIMRSLVSAGFGRVDSVEIDGKEIDPVDFLERLTRKNVEVNEDNISEPESVEEAQGYSIYRAVVKGMKDGEEMKTTVDIIREPHELYSEYSEADTSIPASICAQMLGEGLIEPGLWAPEECIDSERFFEELGKRHFEVVAREERVLS